MARPSASDSKETIESVKFMVGLWKDTMDEGGLAWDDTNNNRAFLSQTISATLNGASIYIETLRKPQQYQTEKGQPMSQDILHAPLPKGPAGQFGFHLLQSQMLMKYSKNQDAAKAFLKWLHAESHYRKFFKSQKGYATPCTEKWESDPLWNVDPVMTPYKVAARLGQAPGYAGPPDAKAAEGLSKYIITDMYAKAVQGMPPEESVKWAASGSSTRFTQRRVPQASFAPTRWVSHDSDRSPRVWKSVGPSRDCGGWRTSAGWPWRC